MKVRVWFCCGCCLIGAGFAGSSRSAPADEPVPAPVVEESTLTLTSRRLQKAYAAAESLLERGETSQALTLLQTILDHPHDSFYSPNPDRPEEQIGLKQRVLESLSRLAPDQARVYDLMFAEKAQELLDADSVDELQQLEEVVRRYYHTAPGYRASLEHAARLFDRGSLYAAAEVMERLLDDPRTSGATRIGLLLKTAVAWRAVGLRDESLRSLQELDRLSTARTVPLGGRNVPLFERDADPLEWLAQFSGMLENDSREALAGAWPMFRGDGPRSRPGSPALPLRESDWVFRTVPMSEADDPRQLELVENELRTLHEKLAPHDYLLFPAMNPLVIDGQIVFRSLGNIKSIDAESGEILWETFSVDNRLQSYMAEISDNLSVRGSRITPLRKFMMQRSWRDLTSGTLSSDGRLVYAVEGQGIVERRPYREFRTNLDPLEGYNLLIAHSLDGGKTVWELGGPRIESRIPLAGAIFLGPPLVHEQELYCLIARDGEIELLCLSNREDEQGRIVPQINWSQPLPLPIDTEADEYGDYRQLAGLSPAFSGGLLVCSTGQGTVVAYDLTRRLFRWRYRYERPPALPRNIRNNLDQVESEHGINSDDHERWIDGVPIISEGKVLVTPMDSAELHCLNLSDGSLRWKAPRGLDLNVAAVVDGAVLMLGRDEVRARELDSGRERWSVAIPLPSGRAALTDGRLLVPLTTGEIALIDVTGGSLLGLVPSEQGRVAGNLVAGEGYLVSQSHDRIFRYDSLDDIRGQIGAPPQSPTQLALQGELSLFADGPLEALPLLQQAARADSANSRIRALYARSLLMALESDFESFRGQADELADLTRGTELESEFRRSLIDALLEQRQFDDAARQLIGFAEQPAAFVDHDHHRVRTDRWAQARLLELDQSLSASSRDALRALSRDEWTRLSAGRTPAERTQLARFFAVLPGMEFLLRERLAELDPYTGSLAMERILLRMYADPDAPSAADGIAGHFRLLMKLEHVEQADVLRQRLLEEFADRPLSDGDSAAALSAWGLENAKLAQYVDRRKFVWPVSGVNVDGPREDQSQITSESPIAVKGDAGLYRFWSFYLNPQMGRLTIYDSFGESRGEWRLNSLVSRSNELLFGREIMIHGHLAVLRFADHFYVLDLLNGGREPALLHGPHYVSAPFPDAVENLRLRLQVESAALPNGTATFQVFDPLHRPFGDVALIDSELIVFQRDNWLIGLDPHSGAELWRRRVSGYGRAIGGSSRWLNVVSVDDRGVDVLRAMDGSHKHRYPIPGLQRVLEQIGSQLIVQTELDGRTQVQRIDPPNERVLWSIACDSQPLLQIPTPDRLVICESGHRVRMFDAQTGDVRFDRTFESDRELLSFWAMPLRDGLLIALRETVGQDAEFNFNAVSYFYPLAHGTLLKLDHRGNLRWDRSLHYQAFNPWQSADSPALIFQSRRSRIDQLRNRAIQTVAFEIIDRTTGQTLSPRNAGEADAIEQQAGHSLNELSAIVSPETRSVRFVGNRWVLQLTYPREE